MDRELSDAWVARVVAWHNRHPLARRIAPAQVQGLGYVDLPFSAAAGAVRKAWRAAFSEPFLEAHKSRRIARWARAYGDDHADIGKAPQRMVLVDPTLVAPADEAHHLWVGTASVETTGGTVRLLIGSSPPHAVFGRRLWSRPRLAAAAALVVLLTALPGALLLRPRAATVDDDGEAVAIAMAPAGALPASAPAPDPAPAPLPPPVADVGGGAFVLPPVRGVLDDDAKVAAREAVAAARAQRSVALAARQPVAWALATPRLRTQIESRLMLPVLQAAAGEADPRRSLRVEVLPVGEDFRAVCWPFSRREDAERLRAELVARGHKVDIIEF